METGDTGATGETAEKVVREASFANDLDIPQGAEEAGNTDELVRVVRDQIKHGADWIKVYADYRWGPTGETRPAFTESELRAAVEIAESSGRHVVAHASSAEAMRRARVGVLAAGHGRDWLLPVLFMRVRRTEAEDL